MGRDFRLLLERNTGSGWEVPLELKPLFRNGSVLNVWAGEPGESGIVKALEIEWWSIRRSVTALFVGKDTPLEVVPGIPEDATLGSKRYFLQNWAPDDPYLGSIRVSELMLEDWHQSTVTLRTKWPAWIAELTRDGTKSRADLEAELEQTAMSKAERDDLVDHLQVGEFTSLPLDRSFVAKDQKQNRDLKLDVSWREPIESFASWLTPAMQVLQSIDRGDLRVIFG